MAPPKLSSEIRTAFLEFFRDRGHEVVPSGSLVPQNDPTLYFTNAGMVPFKDVFVGSESRGYTRATTSQKCMRVSGKHNDLENVGPSPSHHTLFEMLGNFSFGDYFKREAIEMAWAFVTEVLELPKERLMVTYLQGDEQLETDEEAQQIWKEVSGLPEDRIISCGASDNFWRMGDTGPCGPCSEIFYFKGEGVDPARFDQEPWEDGSGWVEIWNLVFMQFDAQPDGSLAPLPAPSVDTGMGLERVTCIQQGKFSNYETDVFQPLLERIAEIAGKPYTGGSSPDDVSMRVIADHARSTAFLIADGVLPDRAGRAYVLRRVMRRAIRHGHRLGIAEPFLHRVALEVVARLGSAYPELVERKELIASVAEQEEVRFRETIERGLGLLEQSFQAMEAEGSKRLPGADAFKLYDTYGFPLDLTEVICAERGFQVDLEGYEAAMAEARKRSEFRGGDAAVEAVYKELVGHLPGGKVRFTGYEEVEGKDAVLALIVEGAQASVATVGQEVEVVVGSTPFYGEAGGQVGDTGWIRWPEGELEVLDTQKPVDGLVVHRGRVTRGELKQGASVELHVDVARREAIRRNHSATHLLHWALRQVLGPQATQKGSLVGPDRFRFDFTQGSAVASEQLARIEDLVNQAIVENHPVRTQVATMEEARAAGAMMIFEEKYGDTVRILRMGPSMELCGGTHARATGEIGCLKILQEQGVAAGVRRLLATTGPGVIRHLREVEGTLQRAAGAAKAGGADLAEKVERIVQHNKALEREVSELQRRLASGGGSGGDQTANAREIAGVKVLGLCTEVTDRGALRELSEQLRDRLGSSIVLVGSESGGKAQLVLTVAKDLTSRFRAGDLIKEVAQYVEGSGGGRPDMAQAGGTNVAGLQQAVDALYGAVERAAG